MPSDPKTGANQGAPGETKPPSAETVELMLAQLKALRGPAAQAVTDGRWTLPQVATLVSEVVATALRSGSDETEPTSGEIYLRIPLTRQEAIALEDVARGTAHELEQLVVAKFRLRTWSIEQDDDDLEEDFEDDEICPLDLLFRTQRGSPESPSGEPSPAGYTSASPPTGTTALLLTILKEIQALSTTMSTNAELFDQKIAALTADVAANTTLVGSAKAAFDGTAAIVASLKDELAKTGVSAEQLAKLDALETSIRSNSDALAAAIPKNTSAASTADTGTGTTTGTTTDTGTGTTTGTTTDASAGTTADPDAPTGAETKI